MPTPPISVLMQALFVAACLPPVLAMAFYARLDLAANVALWAVAHAVILGLPVVLALRRVGKLGWVTAVGGAALIGALPAAALLWPTTDPRGTASSWSNGVATSINGVPTEAACVAYGELSLSLALLGASCGLVFWAYVSFRQRRHVA